MASALSSPAEVAHPSEPQDKMGGRERGRGTVAGWRSVILFGLLTFAISGILSLLALPIVHLPWWKVFRRCVSIGAGLSVLICIKGIERRSIRSYGFFAPREGRSELLFGLLLGVGTLLMMFGLGLATGAYHVAIDGHPLKLWGSVVGLIPAMAMVGVLEELVFRGIILQRLAVSSKPMALVVSSALYAVVHLKTLAPTWGLLGPWFELVGLFLFGSILCVSFFLTRQLYLAVGLHAALAYGALINKLFLEFPRPSLNWLIGTNRLVNGVMNWIALLVMCGVMVWWVRSARWQRRVT